MLRDAGIADIQVKPLIHAFPHGHPRRTVFLDFMWNIREAAIREGFVAEPELLTSWKSFAAASMIPARSCCLTFSIRSGGASRRLPSQTTPAN
jgi:hypothetical protein